VAETVEDGDAFEVVAAGRVDVHLNLVDVQSAQLLHEVLGRRAPLADLVIDVEGRGAWFRGVRDPPPRPISGRAHGMPPSGTTGAADGGVHGCVGAVVSFDGRSYVWRTASSNDRSGRRIPASNNNLS